MMMMIDRFMYVFIAELNGNNNKYTRGAYSYLATGVPLEQHDVLPKPLPSEQVNKFSRLISYRLSCRIFPVYCKQ
jgi:hypothetical protein